MLLTRAMITLSFCLSADWATVCSSDNRLRRNLCVKAMNSPNCSVRAGTHLDEISISFLYIPNCFVDLLAVKSGPYTEWHVRKSKCVVFSALALSLSLSHGIMATELLTQTPEYERAQDYKHTGGCLTYSAFHTLTVGYLYSINLFLLTTKAVCIKK